MAATSWTVDGALAQVLEAIDKGTLRLDLDNPTKIALDQRFRPDFTREHNNGTDWPRESAKVLMLARLVGSYAEKCTIEKAANPAKTLLSGHLNQRCVIESAEFVAKFICPTVTFKGIVFGKWCRGFRRMNPSLLGSKLAKAAKALADESTSTKVVSAPAGKPKSRKSR